MSEKLLLTYFAKYSKMEEANCSKNKKMINCSKNQKVEANCCKNIVHSSKEGGGGQLQQKDDQLQQGPEGANCTKKMASCSKRKVVEANCSKSIVHSSKYWYYLPPGSGIIFLKNILPRTHTAARARWERPTAARSWPTEARGW